MINVLFFIQYSSQGSSSRGIQSGGVILDFGDLCDEAYIRKLFRGRYKLMYQVGREPLKDLTSMRLDEFEAVFYPNGWLGTLSGMKHLLGYSDLKPVFRKEILDKYGPNANKQKPKTTTVYRKGQIITGIDNVKYVYVGHMECIKYTVDNQDEYSTQGHMYIPVDWITRKYGSVVTASAMNSLDIVGDFLLGYLNNYSRLERYLLNNKRKALNVNTNTMGLNISWLMSNNGINTICKEVGRSMIYSYNRKVNIGIKYNMG